MGLLLKGHFRREESQQIRTKSGEAGVHPDDSIVRGEKVGGETCHTRLEME